MSIHISAGITVQDTTWIQLWAIGITILIALIIITSIWEYIKYQKRIKNTPIISSEEGKIK